MRQDVGAKRFWVSIVVGVVLAIVAAAIAGVLLSNDWGASNGTSTSDGRTFAFPSARTDAEVQRDGSVNVTEHLNYTLNGTWHGLYRDIPLRDGEDVTDVSVSGSGRPFQDGANTQLGSAGSPGTFGTTIVPGAGGRGRVERIVLHISDSGPFPVVLTYVLRGAVHVDEQRDRAMLNLAVWGDSWKTGVDDLSGVIRVPGAAGRELRAWMHSKQARVSASVSGDEVAWTATRVPPEHRVEVVTTFPASAVADAATSSVVHSSVDEAAIARDAADEADAAARLRTELERVHTFGVPATVAAALLGLVLFGMWLQRTYRRVWTEPTSMVVTRGASEALSPPDDLPAPLARSLVAQASQGGEQSLVAGVLELVRRGVYRTVPAQGTKRNEVDLAILPGRDARADSELHPHEVPVKNLLDALLDKQPEGVALTSIKGMLKGDKSLAKQAWNFTQAFDRELSREYQELKATRRHAGPFGRPVLGALALLIGGIVAAVVLWNDDRPRLALAAAAAAVLGGTWVVSTIVALCNPSLYTTYTPAWADRGTAWRSFAASLDEFAHLGREQTASLPLWERLLVLGAAFGFADAILTSVKPEVGAGQRAGAGALAGTNPSMLAGFNAASFSGLTSATSSMSSVGAPSSSGSGSSGGGSGGGGGGGW